MDTKEFYSLFSSRVIRAFANAGIGSWKGLEGFGLKDLIGIRGIKNKSILEIIGIAQERGIVLSYDSKSPEVNPSSELLGISQEIFVERNKKRWEGYLEKYVEKRRSEAAKAAGGRNG
jgi:hypothetical protein